MDSSTWKSWAVSIGQSFLFTILLGLVPGAFVAYLAHIQSVWTNPLLMGLGAALMVSLIFGVVKAISHLPPKRTMPDTQNIERCVRSWLDNYKVAVKNDPAPDAHFRLRVTLDSNSHVTIMRSKTEYPEYVQIISFMGMRGDDNKLLEQFSEDERTQIFLDIKLELARAKSGYSGLVDPPENFRLFRRVPIHHNLTEFAFMTTVFEVEAAMILVGLVFLRARHQSNQRKPREIAPAAQIGAGGELSS